MLDPKNTVVFITAAEGAGHVLFSGVLISPDEVLTAAHGVESWDIAMGDVNTAEPVPNTNFLVTPNNQGGTNPLTPSGQFGTIAGDKIHYNDVATTPYAIQPMDFAIIHLAHPVTGAGYMGLDQDFTGGAVTYSGYPALFDTSGKFVGAGPQINVADNLAHSGKFGLNDYYFSAPHSPGASGGASWIMTPNGPEVVGVMDGVFAGRGIQAALTPNAYNEISLWMAEDGESPAIAALYHGVLGRAADAGGLAAWSNLFVADYGTIPTPLFGASYKSAAQVLSANPGVVDGFLLSAEFTTAHPNLTSSAFVTLLYENALGREPETSGLSAWDAALDSHAFSREQVVIGIVESAEAVHHATIYGSIV
jgi:hypothetical protein